MKKKYIQPIIMLEQFEANQQVAATNCALPVHEIIKGTMKCVNPNHGTHKVASEVNNVFITTPSCVTLIPVDASETDANYISLWDTWYFENGTKVYGFYNDVNEAKNGGAKVYTVSSSGLRIFKSATDSNGNDVSDDCFGVFAYPAKYEDNFYPYS